MGACLIEEPASGTTVLSVWAKTKIGVRTETGIGFRGVWLVVILDMVLFIGT